MTIDQLIRQQTKDVANYPKPGINFKDLSPLLLNPAVYNQITDGLATAAQKLRPEMVAGVESRGFWFGIALANKLNLPFMPIRKKGKLPGATLEQRYELEYGTATIEMHKDVLAANQRVLVHDDLLATGGTALAAASLVERLGGRVAGFSFVAELSFLEGRHKIVQNNYAIESLCIW